MEGRISFHLVNDGIESALAQAFAAANGKDARVGGGASTVCQYLKAGLIDELHFVQVPMLLGSGERICEELDAPSDGYETEYLPVLPRNSGFTAANDRATMGQRPGHSHSIVAGTCKYLNA